MSCCGKDLGPMRDCELPSEEDMARFGSETIACPTCGEDVYDEASVCPECGAVIGDTTTAGGGKLPVWAFAAAALVIGGFVVAIVW